MAERALDIYLNDHLGGAMLGSDLAGQIRDGNEGTPLGDVMTRIAAEIEEDREVLLGLMDALDVSRNPVKQATGWLAGKASRVKFSGASSGDSEQGLFMALESLRLGVAGKRCLWLALRQVRERHPPLGSIDVDALIARAEAQEQELERERMAAGARALTG
jgi:hypothetical protein